MKKIIFVLAGIILVGAAAVAWVFLGSATAFEEPKKTLYIGSDAATRKAVIDSLEKNNLLKNETAFEWLGDRLGYWNNIRPGRYDIKKGSSLVSVVRMLRNGQQTPVNLVITKLRTKEDLARLVGSRFECDSAEMLAYLNENNYMKEYETGPEAVMTLVLPDTYTYYWNTTPEKIFKKIVDEWRTFWNEERRQKAEKKGLTTREAYVLSSIVEEETNAASEKGNITSVYLNRISKGMPLQADPTIKFALKDFGLKRIYQKHLTVESPFNTYRNRGLPPGPICTPSKGTIDAVLNAPRTEYLYFVASSKFDGTHVFAATYEEHLKKAREYQQALNKLDPATQEKLLEP